MQIMICVSTDTLPQLRLASQFLIQHIALREAMEAAGQTVPAGTSVDSTPAAPSFIKPSLSLVPPAPNASTVTVPAGSIQTPNLAPADVIPVTEGPAYTDWDKNGVPWDIRIHQKLKSRKANGTWKLKKGIDSAIVESIMRELAPYVRLTGPGAPPPPDANPNPASLFGRTPLPAGADAPVTLPDARHDLVSGGHKFGSTQVIASSSGNTPTNSGTIPTPPPPLHTQSQVPPAPPGTLDQTPGAQGQKADPYRALVTKCTEARRQNKITAEEITQCCLQAGAASLAVLNNTPHLVAIVESYVDAVLVTR